MIINREPTSYGGTAWTNLDSTPLKRKNNDPTGGSLGQGISVAPRKALAPSRIFATVARKRICRELGAEKDD